MKGKPNQATNNIEYGDIQGLVRFGHGRLTEAKFLLLDIVNVEQAKRWLLDAPVTTAEFISPPPDTALHIALSADGLRALQIDPSVIEEFSAEFIVGMTADSNRSRRLGDIEDNAPEHWHWGGMPKPMPHLLLLVYAKEGQLETLLETLQNTTFNQAFQVQAHLETKDTHSLEPFGFTDGISQPSIDWERKVSTNLHERDRYSNRLALGEIMLGYPNEYGQYTNRPLIHSKQTPNLPRAEDQPNLYDLGRNGSYLVIRQLHQDVPGFWQFVDHQSNGDHRQREDLAASMVGRHRDGKPLVARSTDPIDGVDTSEPPATLNQFNFDDDPHGQQCPIGSHIRRSNPRTGDFPPGVTGLISRLIRIFGFGRKHAGDDLIASTRFHRILRRGRAYGSQISPDDAVRPEASDDERGLHFICLGANISRQFEFVQNAWSMGPKFGGLRDETDPLLGNRQPLSNGQSTNHFSHADSLGPAHCTHGMPQFITVKGGGYFFMPGIRALRYIASASTSEETDP